MAFIYLIFMLSFPGVHNQPAAITDTEAGKILQSMHEQIRSISHHSYHLKVEERRTDHSIHQAEMLVSVQNEPLKVQLEPLKPNKGALIEYDAASNSREAVVTPSKWVPAVRFSEDIHGKMLRRGHYAINETTLAFFDRVVSQLEETFVQKEVYGQSVRYPGDETVEGLACYRIELFDPTYTINTYTVKEGESLISIARKQRVNPYKIRELNPEIEDYYQISPGQRIRIPSSYCKRCVVLVDKTQFLPRRMEVYDEKGCFEKFVFSQLIVSR
ncbi:MAG: LysM peptidoglycan-binding domain-containing protein [Bacteroidia bacterium]